MSPPETCGSSGFCHARMKTGKPSLPTRARRWSRLRSEFLPFPICLIAIRPASRMNGCTPSFKRDRRTGSASEWPGNPCRTSLSPIRLNHEQRAQLFSGGAGARAGRHHEDGDVFDGISARPRYLGRRFPRAIRAGDSGGDQQCHRTRMQCFGKKVLPRVAASAGRIRRAPRDGSLGFWRLERRSQSSRRSVCRRRARAFSHGADDG